MTESKHERRRGARVTFRATARLKFESGQVFENCQTSDVSVSGVFVEGVSGVSAWDKCAVDFQLVGRSSSLVLAMKGQVVRAQENGVALQFDEVDEDSFCHLQNIVYYNFRQEGRLGESCAEHAVEIDDESLYLGLAGGTSKSLPGINLGGEREDDDFSGYGDEMDRDIIDRIDAQEDDDDY